MLFHSRLRVREVSPSRGEAEKLARFPVRRRESFQRVSPRSQWQQATVPSRSSPFFCSSFSNNAHPQAQSSLCIGHSPAARYQQDGLNSCLTQTYPRPSRFRHLPFAQASDSICYFYSLLSSLKSPRRVCPSSSFSSHCWLPS